jgi:hypothetical protein
MIVGGVVWSVGFRTKRTRKKKVTKRYLVPRWGDNEFHTANCNFITNVAFEEVNHEPFSFYSQHQRAAEKVL